MNEEAPISCNILRIRSSDGMTETAEMTVPSISVSREMTEKASPPLGGGFSVTRRCFLAEGKPVSKGSYKTIVGQRGVYAIVDPRDGCVMYVGSSSNMQARFRSHYSFRGGSSGRRAERSAWMSSLRAEGLKPEFRVLEEISEGDMVVAERMWLEHFRAKGQASLNASTPGNPGSITALRAEIASLKARVAELEAELEDLRPLA